MGTIDVTAIVLAIISFLSGLGWMLDRKKHRQEVESLRADVKRKEMVYIEKRDCSLRLISLGAYGLREDGTPTVSGKLSAVSKVLKWFFFIIIGLIGLIVTVKVCLLRR